MYKALLTVSLLLFFSFLSAQENVDVQMMQKIKDEEIQHSQITMLAHYLTDVTGSRLTNSPGHKRAIAWTVEMFKKWGLDKAAPEAWGEFGRGWSNQESYLALKQPYYQQLIAYPVPWTLSTKGHQTSSLVLLDRMDTASVDKIGASIKGKLVMLSIDTVLRNTSKPDTRRFSDTELNALPDDYVITSEKMNNYRSLVNGAYNIRRYLKSKGALGLLSMVPKGRDGTVFVQGALSYSEKYEPTLPQMVVSTEDFLRLERLERAGQKVELDMSVENRFESDDLTGYNVVAEITGTDPSLKNQVVMLGGHLDSWNSGTGATDNAAGCVAAMEAVRILKALGVKPKRTIRIALWGAEEEWLLGSFGYVKKHFGDPKNMQLLPEQSKVSVYFNLDNGTGKIRGVYLQNNENVRDIFSAWMKPFSEMGATGVTRSNTGATDILSFDAVGIPAFQFIQDPLEYDSRTHHSNMDVYDHLSIKDLKQASTVMAGFIYNAAMRDEMLPRKTLPKPQPFIFENGFVK